MGTFTAGEVVVIPSPFSDLTGQKYRPALLLAEVTRGDWILSQITSTPFADNSAIALSAKDFVKGNLNRDSFIRPTKLFTGNEQLFVNTAGVISEKLLSEVKQKI